MTMNQVVTIYTESNPNPNSLKFVANRMLVPEGVNKDYSSIASTGQAPLAKALFENFNFIERVFYMNNFVTVTKKEEIDWYEIKGEVQNFIKEFIGSGQPILTEVIPQAPDIKIDEDDTTVKIQRVLEEYIKPAVEMDGGAIVFNSFVEGVVTVSLQGSCSGCPSSTVTLKSGIENLLKRMVPEVREVVAKEA